MPRPRALVVSMSPIHRDSRVLREIQIVARHAHVTTIGYGPKPAGADDHLQLPDAALSLPQNPRGVALLATRRLRRAAHAIPAAVAGRRLLTGRTFDVVVANDARALGLAFDAAGGAPVWADMHEWAPEERTHVLTWRLLVAPLMDDMCRRYLQRAAAVTTIGPAIARKYSDRYGVHPQVLRSAPAYVELSPSPVRADRVRLVHSGGAVYGRALEATIDAVIALDERYTLDFYLVPAGDGGKYLSQLRERAAGCDRITFHDPVPPAELPGTLNGYDVGVFWIPPFNTNALLTLPNKLFDFVQARLAIAVSPNPEMAGLVREYGLGVVAESAGVQDAVASLRELTTERIAQFKSAADAAARHLSFEEESKTGDAILERLLGS